MVPAMFDLLNFFGSVPAFRPEWGLQAPDTQIALTIHGKICWPNRASALCLDAPLLRQFAQQDIVTTTDWPGLERQQIFRGVALADLLLAAGWRGTEVELTGADGYTAAVPLAALRDAGGLIATEWNGMPMPCTRFAPLWLVFPYDTAQTPLERLTQARRSVWKLVEIEIV